MKRLKLELPGLHRYLPPRLFTSTAIRAGHIIVLIMCMWGTSKAVFENLIRAPFNGDESVYITDSRWFDQWLALDMTQLRRLSPGNLSDAPLTPLLIGISRRVVGMEVNREYFWLYGVSEQQDVIGRSVNPSSALLLAARLPMAMLTTATIILLAVFLLKECGFLVSAILVALIVINPALMNGLRIAMTEAPLIFFLIVSMILFYRLLMLFRVHTKAQYIRGRIMALSSIAGISCGLAISSKYTGVLTIPIWLFTSGSTLALIWYGNIKTLPRVLFITVRRWIDHSFLIIGIALIVYLILNPFTWDNPWSAFQKIILRRQEIINIQQTSFPEFATRSLAERTSGFAWGIFTNQNILSCSIGITRQVIMDPVADILRFYPAYPPRLLPESPLCNMSPPWNKDFRPLSLVNLIISALSSLFILFRQIRLYRSGNATLLPSTTVLIWGSTLSVITLFLLPIRWPQYFIPSTLYTTVIIAIGIGSMAQTIFNHILVPGIHSTINL